ncbi:hypothetical protein EDB84DRAFT_1440830 [Lactarius hengduanensis]|nr:hypothetical protein EDB84DRAFT_1440830 [Lactarius hengduanensis]
MTGASKETPSCSRQSCSNLELTRTEEGDVLPVGCSIFNALSSLLVPHLFPRVGAVSSYSLRICLRKKTLKSRRGLLISGFPTTARPIVCSLVFVFVLVWQTKVRFFGRHAALSPGPLRFAFFGWLLSNQREKGPTQLHNLGAGVDPNPPCTGLHNPATPGQPWREAKYKAKPKGKNKMSNLTQTFALFFLVFVGLPVAEYSEPRIRLAKPSSAPLPPRRLTSPAPETHACPLSKRAHRHVRCVCVEWSGGGVKYGQRFWWEDLECLKRAVAGRGTHQSLAVGEHVCTRRTQRGKQIARRIWRAKHAVGSSVSHSLRQGMQPHVVRVKNFEQSTCNKNNKTIFYTGQSQGRETKVTSLPHNVASVGDRLNGTGAVGTRIYTRLEALAAGDGAGAKTVAGPTSLTQTA